MTVWTSFKWVPPQGQWFNQQSHCKSGVLCNMGYPSQTHLKLKSRPSITSILIIQLVWNFAQSTALILPCSVQHFKRLVNWGMCYRQMRFHEIWILDALWMDIPWGPWCQPLPKSAVLGWWQWVCVVGWDQWDLSVSVVDGSAFNYYGHCGSMD